MNFHAQNSAEAISPSATVNFARACNAAGLKHVESIVLAALVESAALIDGEPNVAMSRYELADRTGFSWQQVQRALSSLHAAGWIGRRQNAKRSGEVAVTLVSAKAYALFGLQGGADIGAPDLPREFAELLAGESAALTKAVADAWREGVFPSAEACREFRGPSRVWAQIEFLLNARLETLMTQRQAAFEEAELIEADEEAGRYWLDLGSQGRVLFDRQRMEEATRHDGVAIRSADLRFAKDVLEILNSRSPGAVTASNVGTLAAEILFSRQCGFVWRHDYSDACRVLAAVIGRGGWKRPKRIDSSWYAACRSSVKAVHPQGVRTCAA